MAACASVISALDRDVAALDGPARRAAAERAAERPPPPKNASKMSATEPKPSKFGA